MAGKRGWCATLRGDVRADEKPSFFVWPYQKSINQFYGFLLLLNSLAIVQAPSQVFSAAVSVFVTVAYPEMS